MGINNVKGTHDVIGNEANLYSAIENLLKQIAELYMYSEVRPPVLEYSELFVRGVGESSDVVRKEMYTFLDKGERSLTLRPEFTAGIMRLVVQNKLLATNDWPLKLYYCGPVFRYERPQLGRYRQFNQFGIEAVGHNSPVNDVEVITMAYSMLVSLGLENVKIKINTLGDEESRNAYRDALKEFFKDKVANMCEDCQSRYELNPLRILDCKVPQDKEIIKDAPKMSDYLSQASKDRFAVVCHALKELEIPFEVDDSLVRGLDYYSETVFEFHYQSSNGNDYGAIGAGGHYGKLMKDLGGPELPGIGFSFGIERIVSVLKDDNLLKEGGNDLDFYVMPLGEESRKYAMGVSILLRANGYSVDMCFDNTKMGNMFKRASTKNAKYAVIIGENEVKDEKVIIKDLVKQEQIEVKIDDLVAKVDELFDECICQNKNELENEENHECCHGKGKDSGECCHKKGE